MDSLMFQAMALDVDQTLAGSRVDRIVQTAAGTLVLKLWTGREKRQLLLQAETPGQFHLSRRPHPAPAAPPRFCQLLRARLRRLVSVTAEPHDRVARCRFAGAHGENYDLVFELTGSRGNLILVDDAGNIVDLLWRQEGARTLLPGRPYDSPQTPHRLSWLVDGDVVAERLQTLAEPFAFLERDVTPLTPALLHAIRTEVESGRSFQEVFQGLRRQMQARKFSPCRVFWGQKKSGLLPFPYGQSGFDRIEAGPDLSALFEADASTVSADSSRDLAWQLRQVVQKQRKRLKRRLEKIAADQARHADPEALRTTGDLLLASLHRIRRGDREVVVEDYFRDPPVPRTIPLDPLLTPHENAEQLFKLYRKARRGQEHHARRLQETRLELEWLDQVDLALDEAESADDLYQVQSELAAAGLLGTTRGQLGQRQQDGLAEQLHTTVSPGGRRILWGRNNRTNDYLSREENGPGDLWMHAHGIPGCHLVLKTGGRPDQVPETDVLYAASLAAGYSRGKNDGKVEVMVAEGRFVRRPKGARPGLVTVGKYRTVLVKPLRLDED